MENRYFIAIVPPIEICKHVMDIKKDFAERFNSKGALRSPAHITLHMPFLWKAEKENLLIEKLNLFSFLNVEIKIELLNFKRFGERVIFIDVVKNSHLNSFQTALVKHVKLNLNIFNQYDDLRGFHPHITVAFRDLRKKYFTAAWDEFKQRNFEAEFFLKNFSLLKHDGLEWKVFRNFTLDA